MGRLYDRYSSIVYSVALRVLGDTGGAEDVLQEVFMQLWRNPAAFDSGRGNLGAWLGVIARNRAIDGLLASAHVLKGMHLIEILFPFSLKGQLFLALTGRNRLVGPQIRVGPTQQ